MKKINYLFIIFSFLFFSIACEKGAEPVLDNYTTQLSFEQKEMIEKMEEASMIILQMVTNDEVHVELNEFRSKKIYRDDFIPIAS